MTARLKIKRTDAQDAFVEERSWRCHTCTRMLDPLDPGQDGAVLRVDVHVFFDVALVDHD